MKLLISHKLSLSSIFLVLMSAGIVGWIFHTKTTNILVDNALKRITLDIREAGNTLQQILNTHDEDVLFLANTYPFQGMIRSRGGVDKKGVKRYSQWVLRMQTVFELLLERKNKYQKIRFIDQKGDELVSVYRDANGIIVREKVKQLQNKSHRSYVRDTLKLARGQIYLSEINLNREFGEVQLPYLEVLRVATPIFDARNNERAGLVIVTVEIAKDLRTIQNYVNKSGEDRVIYITNDRGGYLLHPNSEMTYGFDLGKRYRIQENIPQLAGEFLPENLRKQVTLMPGDTNGQDIVNFTKIPFDITHPQRFIAVVMTQKYSNIVAKQSAVLNEIVLWVLFLALAGAGLAILFSIRITRPIQKMTQAVNEFNDKHLSTISLPVTLGDEVGVLARAFNDMIQQVKHSQDRLEEMNINLESRVVARTEELNTALVEAEHANAAKSEFLSRMSHELRTPLNAILGFAQMLELNQAGFNDIQKGNVKEILDAGNHLLNLINDILNLAQIESGKLEINMETVELNELLQDCFKLVKSSMAEKNIELVDQVSEYKYKVKADPTRLKQILLNILSNAIKYNNKNGLITLKSGLIDLKTIRLCIIDSGDGLSEKEIEKLFEPFERLNIKENVEGTGIGLTITKYLSELMGGSIGVESTLGIGTTFWIELKRAL